MATLFNIDIFRELFIGLQVFIPTFLAELTILIVSSILGYIGCFVLDYQFFGLMTGFALGQLIGLVVYFTLWLWSSNFVDWHDKLCEEECVAVLKRENAPTNDLGEQVVAPKKQTLKVDGTDVMSWKGFVVFESSFVILMFLELLWNRVDTLIASFIFTESEIAAQASWMNLVVIVDCFSYGFGVSVSSKISYFMVQGDIATSKKAA